MRPFLNVDAARKIYEMVIVPLLLYGSLIPNLHTTTTQVKKLRPLKNRAELIVGGKMQVKLIELRMREKDLQDRQAVR